MAINPKIKKLVKSVWPKLKKHGITIHSDGTGMAYTAMKNGENIGGYSHDPILAAYFAATTAGIITPELKSKFGLKPRKIFPPPNNLKSVPVNKSSTISPADQAHAKGWISGGWGTWKDKSGKTVAKTVNGKLVPMKTENIRQIIRECIDEIILETSSIENKILNVLSDYAEYGQSVTLKTLVQKTKSQPNVLRTSLKKLIKSGQVAEVDRDTYELDDPSIDKDSEDIYSYFGLKNPTHK